MKLHLRNNYKDDFFSERLRFSLIKSDDNEMLYKNIDESITGLWIGWEPCKNIEENKKWLNRKLEAMNNDVGIDFLIYDLTGIFVGSVGLEIDGSHFGITVWIIGAQGRKGYGYEAVREMLKWIKNHTSVEKVLYSYTDGNEASRKLLEKMEHSFYEKVTEKKNRKEVFVFNSLIHID